jgi:hypothetical protein
LIYAQALFPFFHTHQTACALSLLFLSHFGSTVLIRAVGDTVVARGNATRAPRARTRADRPRYPGRTLGPRPTRANHPGSASGAARPLIAASWVAWRNRSGWRLAWGRAPGRGGRPATRRSSRAPQRGSRCGDLLRTRSTLWSLEGVLSPLSRSPAAAFYRLSSFFHPNRWAGFFSKETHMLQPKKSGEERDRALKKSRL